MPPIRHIYKRAFSTDGNGHLVAVEQKKFKRHSHVRQLKQTTALKNMIKETETKIEKLNVYDDAEVIDLCTPITGMFPSATVDVDVDDDSVAQTNKSSSSSSPMAVAKTPVVRLVTNSNDKQQSTLLSLQDHVSSFVSRTLTSNSSSSSRRRLTILPTFSASIENPSPDLLLANVPNGLLTKKERDRRCGRHFRPPVHVIGGPPMNILINTKVPSLFWNIYEDIFGNLVEHLRVDLAIIDYNYTRMLQCIYTWADERMRRFQEKPHDVTLKITEYALALEFYLQMDVDLFYMKTCSFRQVNPRSFDEGLFCRDEPEACHAMTKCGNCSLCCPKYDVERRQENVAHEHQLAVAVEYGPSQRHQFVNKYEAILNCPASCDTYNIVYVLTCPCGKFDYIGETNNTLADRVSYHRLHGNRIMHECFLGKKNIEYLNSNKPKSEETLIKNDMRLYQHSTECSLAIQIFLDENPRYWCFVPMSNKYDSSRVKEEQEFQQQQQLQTMTSSILNMEIMDNDIVVNQKEEQDEEKEISRFVQDLPPPPPNYYFSKEQSIEQFAFFKTKQHLSIPNIHLDLYNAKIIAVSKVPHHGSNVLRRLVESLFITHGETKLNSSGNLVSNGNNNSNSHIREDDVPWCESLVRHRL